MCKVKILSLCGAALLTLQVCFGSTALADSNPTITISSIPNTPPVSGVLKFEVTFQSDSSMTSSNFSFTKIGINIGNAPSNYSSNLTLGGKFGYLSTIGSNKIDAAWDSGPNWWLVKNAVFYVDTSNWPDGLHAITAYIQDNSGRIGTSSAVTFLSSNSGPSVEIASTSQPYPGAQIIAVSFGIDYVTTSKIIKLGVTIEGAPSDYAKYVYEIYGEVPEILGGFGGGRGGGHQEDWGPLGTLDATWDWCAINCSGKPQNAYFVVKTSTWPPGTYTVGVGVQDSFGRQRTSRHSSFVIRVPAAISLNEDSYSNNSAMITASLSGANALNGASIRLFTSGSSNGPWFEAFKFVGDSLIQSMNVSLPLGTWMRASSTGSTILTDAVSTPIQFLGIPTALCTFPKTGKLGSPIKGKCIFSSISGGFPIVLGVDSGSGFKTIATSIVNQESIPISVTPKVGKSLRIQVTSEGMPNLYRAFSSNISSITLVKSLKASKK